MGVFFPLEFVRTIVLTRCCYSRELTFSVQGDEVKSL